MILGINGIGWHGIIKLRFFSVMGIRFLGISVVFGQFEANDAERQFKEVRGTVFEEVKRGVLADIADITIRQSHLL